MTRLEKRRRILRITLIVLVVLTLAFIWTNSLRSGEASLDQSEKFKAFLIKIFTLGGRFKLTGVFSFIVNNVRKVAHFVEFALLGGLLVVCFRTLKKASAVKSFFTALLFSMEAAAFDEMLQLISHRGSAYTDVILDVFGATFGALLVTLIFLILGLLKKRSGELQPS